MNRRGKVTPKAVRAVLTMGFALFAHERLAQIGIFMVVVSTIMSAGLIDHVRRLQIQCTEFRGGHNRLN